ncbi:MAG: DUF177 domain-containing protein [Bacteroidota bacterium]|nr:DUF177 domain-containing protein [Bacteroidota bacterium]
MAHPVHIPIRILGLPEGGHDIGMKCLPGEIGLPAEFEQELDIRVHLEKTHEQTVLRAHVETKAVYPCDRCLEPVTLPIDVSFTLFYTRDAEAARRVDEDDVRIIDPDETVIDLADDVRDFVLLSIPMRRVCPDDAEGNPTCIAPVLAERLVPPGISLNSPWDRLKFPFESDNDV